MQNLPDQVEWVHSGINISVGTEICSNLGGFSENPFEKVCPFLRKYTGAREDSFQSSMPWNYLVEPTKAGLHSSAII